MPKLIGAQRLVLQAILDLPKDSADNVADTQIAGATKIALDDVRNWLETLEGEGYVNIARTTVGLSASVTAQGKLILRQYAPFSSDTPGSASVQLPASAPSAPISSPGSTSHVSAGQTHPGQTVSSQPISLFYSYSHEDESLRDELAKHLSLLKRQGVIAEWHDRRIGAGDEWKGAIDKNLDEAHIILLLVSASFLASDYCWDVETKRALERHDKGEAKVIPVILRPVDWKGAPFGKLQALPKDGKAITSWQNRDEAFTDVAVGIRTAIGKLPDELDRLLTSFLSAYSGWFFNASRILKFGALKQGFGAFSNYSETVIKERLSRLYETGRVQTKTSETGASLYGIKRLSGKGGIGRRKSL